MKGEFGEMISDLNAYSADREQAFWLIVNT